MDQGKENGGLSGADHPQISQSNPSNKEMSQLGMGVINQPGGMIGRQNHQEPGQLSQGMKEAVSSHDGLQYFPVGNTVPEQNDYFEHFKGDTGSGFSYGPVTGFSHATIPMVTPEPPQLATPSFRHDTARESDGREYPGVVGYEPESGDNIRFGRGTLPMMTPGVEPGANPHYPNLAGHSNHSNHGNLLPEEINQEVVIAQADPSTSLGSSSHGFPHNHGQNHLSRSLTGYPGEQGNPFYQEHQSMESNTGTVNDVYFDFDSWHISQEAGQALETNAAWLKTNKVQSVTIEGHCDQRGTRSYNMVLGKKRAQAARDYLVDLGANPENIKTISFGKERPFCHEGSEYCYQTNRRGHFVVR